MNKNNAKALSTLRQKIRKYNRDYESQITSYKQVLLGPEVGWGEGPGSAPQGLTPLVPPEPRAVGGRGRGEEER